MSNNHIVLLPAVQLHATGRVIANFAWQHLQAATLFRDHLARLEAEHASQEFSAFFESIRCYGSACIMSATASLEALINELFIAHGRNKETIGDRPRFPIALVSTA